MESASIHILGCMTGTSCDGIDFACLEFSDPSDETAWEIRWSAHQSYPSALRQRVLQAQRPGVKLPIQAWMELNRDLGDWYSDQILKQLKTHSEVHVDLIANHGQTVAHFPKARAQGTTLQLGDAARIAAQTGISVASDFRAGDMAAGGQGAPLVPIFHRMILRKMADSKFRAIQNIGGIGNITYLSPNDEILAWDTGPGNLWSDEATYRSTRGKQSFDSMGRLARKGTPDLSAIRKILKGSYFVAKPPKSTGRDDLPFAKLTQATRARGNDLIATAIHLTAESIALSVDRFIQARGFPLHELLICGGGAKNTFLMELLSQKLSPIEVKPLEALPGLTAETIEASAFAYLGFLSLQGGALGGSWTGAKAYGPSAQLTPSRNWVALIRKVAQLPLIPIPDSFVI
jgi:anhydro-N-acetylmuramic acid kinase